MLVRIAVLIGIGLLASACANDVPASSQLLATSSIQAPVQWASVHASGAIRGEAAAAATSLPKKTMADRVLTAIALERVTGMKPDPARLIP